MASNCCFLLEPGGLPLAFFNEEGEEADPPPPPPAAAAADEGGGAAVVGDENPPLDWFTVTEGGGGVGERPNAMVPSGPYFLGLPLFLFIGSPPMFMFSPEEAIAPPGDPSPPPPAAAAAPTPAPATATVDW